MPIVAGIGAALGIAAPEVAAATIPEVAAATIPEAVAATVPEVAAATIPEAAAGAAGAAGLGAADLLPAGTFFLPGTATPIAEGVGIGAFTFPGEAAAAAAGAPQFFVPGTETPLVAPPGAVSPTASFANLLSGVSTAAPSLSATTGGVTPVPGVSPPVTPSTEPPGLAPGSGSVSGVSGPGAGAGGIAPPPSAPISPAATGTLGSPPGGVDFGPEGSGGFGSQSLSGQPFIGGPNDPGVGGGDFSSATPTPSAAPQTSLGKFIADPTASGLGDVVANNALSLVPLAGLGYEFMNQPKLPDPTKLTGNIQTAANQFGTQGQNLQQYLTSGTLPPGVQSGINQAADSAKAAVRSRHASSGSSGSSAEFEELNSIDTKAATEGSNLAFNLLQQGVSESGLSAELYKYLLQTTLAQDTQLGNAIGNFSGALAGLSRGAQFQQTA